MKTGNEFLDAAIEMLQEFHEAFGYDTDPQLRKTLIMEEAMEVLTAKNPTDLLKEICDFIYVQVGTEVCLGVPATEVMRNLHDPDMPQEAAICNAAAEVVNNRVNAWGVDLILEAFVRVHRSNMSKLGPDGKPMLREDGKRLKGPNYKPADLSDLFVGNSTMH